MNCGKLYLVRCNIVYIVLQKKNVLNVYFLIYQLSLSRKWDMPHSFFIVFYKEFIDNVRSRTTLLSFNLFFFVGIQSGKVKAAHDARPREPVPLRVRDLCEGVRQQILPPAACQAKSWTQKYMKNIEFFTRLLRKIRRFLWARPKTD